METSLTISNQPPIENDIVSEYVYRTKYLQRGETFEEGMARIAAKLADTEHHRREFLDILMDQRFLPAGRIQAAVGARRDTTPYNCYVSGILQDSSDSIVRQGVWNAYQTMRMGGGIGYDFSRLRPNGARIKSLDSVSSGPVGNGNYSRGFMDIFDAVCSTVQSAGHRRGAQMGVMRVDHPDIMHFIRAKREPGRLTNFNVSVGVTNAFMEAVKNDNKFDLKWGGEVYEKVNAVALWDEIMRSTWDHAEPGVLFLDTINLKNNLWDREKIEATNPCGEQPLPPNGACLLGSLNLVKYVDDRGIFKYEKFKHDIVHVVNAMDNVIDVALYPLEAQKTEALNKRRMGIGVTGLADAMAMMGQDRYGSTPWLGIVEDILMTLRDTAYWASVERAQRKGSFPLFEAERYINRQWPGRHSFANGLPEELRNAIAKHGIRNSHLLSIAPTGTISLAAGNVSSGIEPHYTRGVYQRNILHEDGSKGSYNIMGYAEWKHGVSSDTSDEVTLDRHVDVLALATKYVDSAVSKTCNVGPDVSFNQFKDVYMKAYDLGCKGITTFRPPEYGGKREGIMKKAPVVETGAACYFDEQGNRTCD